MTYAPALISVSGAAYLAAMITLAVTPLRKYFGWNNLGKLRRMLGLFAFFYGSLHLITYSIFDKSLSASAIGKLERSLRQARHDLDRPPDALHPHQRHDPA